MPDKPRDLRIFFFSDWRTQPLQLAEDMLDASAPIDLIIYGGDDIRRFKNPPAVPDSIVTEIVSRGLEWIIPSMYGPEGTGTQARNIELLSQGDLLRMVTDRPEAAIDVISEVFGHPPLYEPVPSSTRFRSLGEILELFQPAEEGNWLYQMSKKARFGIGAVLGNDCVPSDRNVLLSDGVRDLHTTPTEFGGWGFVGIEGGIYQEADDERERINDIGYILHPEHETAPHLSRGIEHLALSTNRIVIVSHTPPAGCRLDIAIRFGLDYLGSPTLAKFIRTKEPALVLCGHCHSRGGKIARIGNTLVVNAASDDTHVKKARAAVIELQQDRPAQLSWIDPSPHNVIFVSSIGEVRARRLAEIGVVRRSDLFAASPAALQSAGIGKVLQNRFQALRLAMENDRPIWFDKLDVQIPDELFFYDVETGLSEGSLLGASFGIFDSWPQEPWMIGALAPGAVRVDQWVAAEEDKATRREMYQRFLESVRLHSGATLCSWSGTAFDNRAMRAGLDRWHRRAILKWDEVPQLDLLSLMRKHLVLPTKDWSLKTIASWCGFRWNEPEDSELDGFEVGVRYEEYRHFGKPLPIVEIMRYNSDDVLALAHVASWVRDQISS